MGTSIGYARESVMVVNSVVAMFIKECLCSVALKFISNRLRFRSSML